MSPFNSTPEKEERSLRSNIRYSYLLALWLIAALSISGYAGLSLAIKTHKSTGAIVNISGRQRMLTQKIAVLAHDLLHDLDAEENNKVRKELIDTADLIEKSHEWLLRGNEDLNLPGAPSDEILSIYFKEPVRLDEKIRSFTEAAKALAKEPDDEKLVYGNPNMIIIERLSDRELVDSLDMLVDQFQKESESDITKFELIGGLTLVLIVLSLTLVGRFIFRPMAIRIERDTKAIKESEAKYRSLFENANDAIYMIDADTWRILDCNKKAAELDGYSLSELRGMPIKNLIPENELPLRESILNKVKENYFPDTLTGIHHKRKDGSLVPIEVNSSIEEIGGGNVLISVARDVTERIAAEKELLAAKKLLERIYESLEEAVFLVDIKTRNVISCNAAVERIFGYRENEVIGRNTKFLHVNPETYEKFGKELFATLDTDGIFHTEFEMKKRDGSVFPTDHTVTEVLDDQGKRVGVVSVVRDITARKKAQEDLIRLATAVEQATETVVITDIEGIIQYVNPAFEKITGYSRQEALGQNPRILSSGKQSQEFYKTLWDTIKGGGVWTGHFVNKKKNGSLYEEDATITPIHNLAGEIVNFVAVKRDVTNEVRLERQIRHAQKMEAIGTLAGGIAHDFNNILSAIIGYNELVLDDTPEGTEQQANLMEVAKAGRRAKELVKQILTFSRQTEQKRGVVEPALIVKEDLKMLRASMPSTIEIDYDIEPDAGHVTADPTQLSQVVMNLCANADHSMRGKGGVLSVNLKSVNVDDEFALTHPGLRPGKHIIISISDTGVGMDKETMERIFDPFFTTKSVGEGVGMGLATAHGIVTSHGGIITVYSEPGKGSTFNVYLPKIEKEPAPETMEPVTIYGGDERILFVDDEAPLANMGKRMLERYGYEVTAMSDSEKALEHFLENPDAYDLVITDQTMPKLTGEYLAKEVMRLRPNTPVILTSGFSHIMTPERAREIGAFKFITKPFIARDIAGIAREALNSKHSKSA